MTTDFSMWMYLVLISGFLWCFVFFLVRIIEYRGKAHVIWYYITIMFGGGLYKNIMNFWARYLMFNRSTEEWEAFLVSNLWHSRIIVPSIIIWVIAIHHLHARMNGKDQ